MFTAYTLIFYNGSLIEYAPNIGIAQCKRILT